MTRFDRYFGKLSIANEFQQSSDGSGIDDIIYIVEFYRCYKKKKCNLLEDTFKAKLGV